MENNKKNPRNISSAEIQPDGTVKVTSYNEPLMKNSTKSQKTDTNPPQNAQNVEFFDATIDDDTTPARDIQREVEEAKKRAIQEHNILESYRNNPPKKDKSYSSSVIASVVSVAILLALTLVFFLWLKWYPVGLVFAILTIIAIQIWISFLKRINKKYDVLEGVSDQDEIDLQNHLREKYPNLYEENTPKNEKASTKKSEKLTSTKNEDKADATPLDDKENKEDIENNSPEINARTKIDSPEIKEESAKNN